jgi:hypothetical protein
MFASIFNTAVVEPYDEQEVRQALINHGEKIMSTQSQIQCTTTEEHSHPTTDPSTSIINPSLCESTQTQQIQGATGNTYAPMDTSPQTPEQQQNARIKMLMEMLNTTLNGLVKELQTPSQPQTDLEEAVNTTLEQADWFKEKLADLACDYIDDKDFDYEIGNSVERYMRNTFDPNDHVDFHDLVAEAVENRIDEIVADAVEERLADLLEEKLANARITINF